MTNVTNVGYLRPRSLQGAAHTSMMTSVRRRLDSGLFYFDGKKQVRLDYKEAELRLKEREREE